MVPDRAEGFHMGNFMPVRNPASLKRKIYLTSTEVMDRTLVFL